MALLYHISIVCVIYFSEVEEALRTRPKSLRGTEVEGMVLPPKPAKRHAVSPKNFNILPPEPKQYPGLPKGAPERPVQPPPRKPDEKEAESIKTKKNTILPSMRGTLKPRDRKSLELLNKDIHNSNESLPSSGYDTQSPSITKATSTSSIASAGSRISLNELQGGLNKMMSRRGPRPDHLDQGADRPNTIGQATKPNSTLKRTTNSEPGRSTLPRNPPPEVPKASLKPAKPMLPAARPHTSNKPTLISDNQQIQDHHTEKQTQHIRDYNSNKPAANKPVLPVKPALKPRPSIPGRGVSPGGSSIEQTLTIDTVGLKPELISVAELMRLVYSNIKMLITLADERNSENIRDKTERAMETCRTLVDELSSYRDSIGPVARMKVNKHLTAIESGVNDFSKLSTNMPRIATATDLEKLSKTLCNLSDNLENLATSLKNL